MKIVIGIIIFALLMSIYLTKTHAMKTKKQRHPEIATLFASSDFHSEKKFTAASVEGLPQPVQQYLTHVLPEGQPYINSVRLKHDGYFKTGVGKSWTSITGEQYFTTATPGFVWIGKTSLFTAKDIYVKNQGQLVVKLLSLFKVVDEKGAHIDQGELLRWLGESVWFPTNFIPGNNISWQAINDSAARVTCHHNEMQVSMDIYFNENHEISRLETERYMEKDRKEKWFGEVSEYREIEGIKVPTRIKAGWDLKEGVHNYVDFKIQQLEFNNPAAF